MNQANAGKDMVAKLKNTPMTIITLERWTVPWNSDIYDISTANGPQVLNENGSLKVNIV